MNKNPVKEPDTVYEPDSNAVTPISPDAAIAALAAAVPGIRGARAPNVFLDPLLPVEYLPASALADAVEESKRVNAVERATVEDNTAENNEEVTKREDKVEARDRVNAIAKELPDSDVTRAVRAEIEAFVLRNEAEEETGIGRRDANACRASPRQEVDGKDADGA